MVWEGGAARLLPIPIEAVEKVISGETDRAMEKIGLHNRAVLNDLVLRNGFAIPESFMP